MTERSRAALNIVTGALGVGKTTTIAHLLAARPAGQRWAVLVNEFGRVGIDGAQLAASSETGAVEIREVAGGCLCCAVGVPTRVALTEILRRVRPHRLLVEPSGLGHPAGLLELLMSAGLAEHLDLQGVLTLVDPRRVDDLGPRDLDPTALAQIEIADVLVGTKVDLADAEQIDRFRRWGEGLFPAKPVHLVSHGRVDPAWLSLPRGPGLHHAGEAGHTHHHPVDHAGHAREDLPVPGRPVRLAGEALGARAIGWRFHPDDRFDERELAEALELEGWPRRVKGLFRIGDRSSLAVDRVDGDVYARPSAWRRDSRVEVIGDVDSGASPQQLESRLLGALRQR